MAKKSSKNKSNSNTIALNKKARHNYTLSDKFEGGMSLQGWEIKSIRSGKVNISDCYVHIKDREAYLLGAEIMPLKEASTHVVCDPNRDRKLLLNRRELDVLAGAVDREGYSIIATAMYWRKNWVKLEFYLGKGKKDHDKRADIKDREWAVDKGRILKNKNLNKE
ncbi:SsrA-binding protein SmpB [Colwellia sp. 1_MG-2023]|uniref:SsrA-binding protein SmpB n=1 Tax=unclassified Colwellia TaxID=196834 RepID=UPI001C084250|nr:MULTISPECIES: SsrA-binding protein SmpB [unclassified Colwellia]MBU2926275.1 SsrA-binding protein SmpB [Colwellia sp. C2M11]MDO6654160.1 SsrA-binding protein SmpB [Colwellia sp. 3_MG-2023]MDO6667204.1 SsrA-binding protein SmpB [Colwellia sp. 2_MG-2023]MDO6691562.1 SsrA-binding protein SmpB [Colwellia sp. 1_MG-2023]